MKASSCPNLNRETTSFPNFFTLFQDPDCHDKNTTTLNKRPKIDRGDDTEATLNKRPKIDRGDDTEGSEASPFKDILSSFVSFDEMNEPGYLPDCWDQEDDQTLAKWPPSPNGSESNASVGSNQFNPASPGIHRDASKMSESTFDFFLNELEPPRFEHALGSLSTSPVVDPLYHEHYSRSSFKRFSSSALGPPSTMNLVRKPNNQERAITFFRNLNLVTNQERAQRSRPMSSTQLHHMISWRNRREKLIKSFQALQSLLPLGTKKDEASVLATTTDYLASLKAQVEELTKTSRDLEEKVQLLATKKEAADDHDHQEVISLFPDQRLDVRITHEAESTSQARVIGLQVVLRGECNVMDSVTRILEFMRQVENASLLSVEVDAPVVDSINPIDIVRLRLRIEVNFKMEARNMFPDDFSQQLAPPIELPRLTDQPRPSSSSTSLLSPLYQAKQAFTQIPSTSQFPSLETKEAIMTGAGTSQKPSAFKRFKPALGPSIMNITAGARKPNAQKRAITFFRFLSLTRIQGQKQGSRAMSRTRLHHMISERTRAQKLFDSFQALKSLLPPGTKKDKVSLLASTTDYLVSLKAQVDELDKRAKHLEEKVQLLTTKEDANDHQEESLSPNQRLDVRITEEAQALIIRLLSQTILHPNPHF
ncbi:uncharacterized protein LOC131324867 [Rhododendron vialii]|uniref:uncharacterized protein LOC131324867 n=1 Tax=Rhododendron vialii TaxID=182163 RepID=UPI00265FB6C7|nr:uncharacterized protein LOC131324867 [Rhododendron vialii]